MIRLYLTTLLLFWASIAYALDCSTTATVQNAIDTASSGDTITCDTGGWSGAVTIGSEDGPLTLDGNGVSVTGTLRVNASSAGNHRVTGFTFSRGSGDGNFCDETSTVRAVSHAGDKPYRIDNNTFVNGAHCVVRTTGLGPGLWDHNTFNGQTAANEYFHIEGTGAGSTAGWTDAITPGSAEQVYFEDNTMTNTTGDQWFDSYYGARWVARFNTFNNWNVEAHGNTFASARWWEVYHNDFTGSGSIRMCFRGGSGVIFNNTGTNSSRFVEESDSCNAGDPNCDEVGKGQNWVQYPFYWWNNAAATYTLNTTGCAPAIAGAIVDNLDAFDLDGESGTTLPATCSVGEGWWKTDEGGDWNKSNQAANDGTLYKCTSTNIWTQYYTPYTYPHPLASSSLISASRVITWDPGVQGGIPSRSTTCYTDTGALDSVATINSEIAGCASGQIVQLQAGTYTVSSQILIANDVTLKGAGTGSTTLNCSAAWHCVQMGNFPAAPSGINVTGSPAKGDTTITVASTTGLAINDYIVIDQLNDGVEVKNDDTAFGAAECRSGAGTRCLGQMVKITNISGNDLTIDPELHHSYSSAQTPQVWEVTNVTEGAALEALTITRTNNQGGQYNNVKMVACSGCWIDDIISNDTDFWHVDIDRSMWNTIRDSYFDDGQAHTGGRAYGVVSNTFSTANLIENNVFVRNRHSMLLQNGASGNVYGYNYSAECYQGEDWLAADMNTHGSHPTMNLFEGNIGCKVYGDNAHGSSSFNTVYRNHIVRESFPAEYPSGVTQARRVVDIEQYNPDWNIVANVLGSSGQSWNAFDPGSTRTPGSGQYVYTFGYFSDGASTAADYATIEASTYRHGNYDYQSSSQIWDSGNSYQVLDDSFYLGGKPTFFSGCTWPPIDPAGPTINDIPAKLRYESASCPSDRRVIIVQ